MGVTLSGIRGMLLEEAILFLLQSAGYKTITDPGFDSTLSKGRSGMEVFGRGAKHQIDAIADYPHFSPFTYPHRLLVEAKCYAANSPIELEVVRNAVGVVKDVSEYWHKNESVYSLYSRYHYEYAIFSASGFTKSVQDYAVSHDVYLVPLQRNIYLKPVVDAIRNVTQIQYDAFARELDGNKEVKLNSVRLDIRDRLRGARDQFRILTQGDASDSVGAFIQVCHVIGSSYIGVLDGRVPLLLTPYPSSSTRRDALWNPQDEPFNPTWNHIQRGLIFQSRRDQDNLSFDISKETLGSLIAHWDRQTQLGGSADRYHSLSVMRSDFDRTERLIPAEYRIDHGAIRRLLSELPDDPADSETN